MKEIIEGNKLIAEFMGYKYYPENIINGEAGTLEKDGRLSLHANSINKNFCTKYHFSWDWLMPVVEKIEKETYEFTFFKIVGCHCEVYNADNSNTRGVYFPNMRYGGETKIEATWITVVEFIKWYNQNVLPQIKSQIKSPLQGLK